ncbi:8117_t:CDS:2, partial [Cetraspora pellucida]
KYFYSFNQPYTEFSVGDIMMFGGKFVVKNLEQYVTVSCTNVIATGDSNQEFEANEILLSILHCMFIVLVSHNPKESTDIIFVTTNVNVIQNMQPSVFSVTSKNYLDIDLIAEDGDSTILWLPKRPHVLISRPKQVIGSTLAVNESAASFSNLISSINNNRRVQIENEPDDDELDILSDEIVNDKKNKQKRKALRKNKK